MYFYKITVKVVGGVKTVENLGKLFAQGMGGKIFVGSLWKTVGKAVGEMWKTFLALGVFLESDFKTKKRSCLWKTPASLARLGVCVFFGCGKKVEKERKFL